jgi:glycosyltransferase involved in cell wall biosynthesis
MNQSYRNIEIIVVGDGCTDNTTLLMKGLMDPRLRFVNLPSRGSYPIDPLLRWMVAGTQSMNAALALAAGDYVTHLDDDDEFLPDRIERLVSCAYDNDWDFVWHPFWYETASGEWLLNSANQFTAGQVTTSSVFYRTWLKSIAWDINAYRWREGGDWNRFRRIKYLRPKAARYPEPLLRHYKERNQRASDE